METVVARACGLDVHEASVVACVLLDEGKARPKKFIKTFQALHSSLVELRDWLMSLEVTHVVMEGTGVYWRPVYDVLEGTFDLWLVNARHVKNVPGRKSDVIDAEWLAKLLRNGLLRKSFVPAADIRALRDISRYRRTLVQAQSSEKNRILKLCETMGLKLAMYASDVFGVSGMAMLRAIAEGKPAEETVQLARGQLRRKLAGLRLALDCTIRDHHRTMLCDQLARLDATAKDIAKYDEFLEQLVEPHAAIISLLCTIHGIRRVAAIEIFAETGPDLASFPAPHNFAAWAGTSPGLNASAGKNKSGRHRRGNPHLTSILIECALGATRKKNTYLSTKYHRLKARRPTLVALFAIANKLAHAVFRVITTRTAFHDLGADYLDRRNRDKTVRNLVRRLIALGVDAPSVARMLPSAAPQPIAEVTIPAG